MTRMIAIFDFLKTQVVGNVQKNNGKLTTIGKKFVDICKPIFGFVGLTFFVTLKVLLFSQLFFTAFRNLKPSCK